MSARCWLTRFVSEPHFVLGGGSNIVITGDIKPLVIKVELQGKQLVSQDDKACGDSSGGWRKLARFCGPGPWPKVGLGWKTWP
jgi:UDP-N-acetylenolpyruvoylglucosamine reductase